MKNIFPFLVLTSLVFFVLPLKIAAQQKKTTSSNNPVYVISDDGSSRVMLDGLKDKREVEKFIASSAKKGIKGNVNTNIPSGTTSGSTGGLTATFKSKPAGVDKVIKYGPWRMQNKLRLMTDSLAGILRFGVNRNINVSSDLQGKRKIKVPRTDMETILKLSPRTQITVLDGHLYSIQVGQFVFNKNAYTAMDEISTITTLPVVVVIKNGYYHLLVEGFQNLKDANLFIGQLAKIGYKGAIVRIREIGNASDASI